jgi:multidrug efflux pump subunit AcrA (membrane-fusion protein)
VIRDSSTADGQTLEHARNHSRDFLRQLEERQRPWGLRESVARAAHASLRVVDAAYALANEGRRLLECDRLTVLTCQGRGCRVAAISGQDVFDRRSNVVRQIEHFAACVVKTQEPLWHVAASLRDADARRGETRPRAGTDLPPQLEEALDAFLDESHARQVVVVPLLKAPAEEAQGDDPKRSAAIPPLGALVIEQFQDVALSPGSRESVEFLRQTGAQALGNALEHEGLFLAPLSRAIGQTWGLRRRPWTKIALGAVAAVILALCFVPADLELQGRGTLEPVGRHDVFAPLEVVVQRVHVQHGSIVAQDQLLVELRNTDVEVKRTELANQVVTTQERLRALNKSLLGGKLSRSERDRLHGERAQAVQTLESLEKQLAIYQRKAEQLQVRATMAGQVVTWDVQDLLMHRPVERGQMLLSLADVDGDWQLEIRVPEDRVGHIAQAQAELGADLPVSFILALDPGVTHEGTLTEVHGRAEVHGEEGNTVLLRVAIDKSQLPQLRRGATAIAKVHCGRRSLGYAWFHDVWEFIQSRVLFRL